MKGSSMIHRHTVGTPHNSVPLCLKRHILDTLHHKLASFQLCDLNWDNRKGKKKKHFPISSKASPVDVTFKKFGLLWFQREVFAPPLPKTRTLNRWSSSGLSPLLFLSFLPLLPPLFLSPSVSFPSLPPISQGDKHLLLPYNPVTRILFCPNTWGQTTMD